MLEQRQTRIDTPRFAGQRTLPMLGTTMLIMLALPSTSATAQEPPREYRGAESSPTVVPFLFEGDLRELPQAPEWRPGDPIKEIPRRHYFQPGQVPPVATPKPQIDPLLELQENAPEAIEGEGFATPILNIDGQGFTGVNPPDTVGDAGPDYFIQMINGGGGAVFSIYNKSDGSVAAGPIALDSLGAGSCASGLGDPIVLYDPLADRWLLSEFSGTGNVLCVYISQTSDPITGGWFNYDFTTPNFPDYPKYGVWPDAYYVSSNESGPSAVYALDRAKMLIGEPATSQRFTAPDLPGFGFQALTPADLDGATPPPADTPGLFMRHRDTESHGTGICANPAASDCLERWEFVVDWVNPGNSTFTQLPAVEVSEFDSDLCGLLAFSAIAMPGVPKCSGSSLDPLREVVMFRLAYRNLESHEALVGNFVTDVTGNDDAGVRWFELRRIGTGGWWLEQEGTYAIDSESRWMAAIAMDTNGNIALGHNVSSGSTFPSLRYTGRLAADPLGTLPQGEHPLVAGSAANGSNRYGDYSSMSVDPEDDCTFWFTGEYNVASTWSTRIGAFKFDSCSLGPDFTLAVTPRELDICAPLEAEYTVEVGSALGFADLVTLAVTGEPAGTSTSFSVNPVTPPDSSILTIGDTGMATAGVYSLEVSGTSTTGTKLRNVDLGVFTATPAAPTLTSPADGATDVDPRPTFTWSAVDQARTYRIEIATDPAFANVVLSQEAIEGTSFTPSVALETNTRYYWRVQAENACNPGPVSSVFSFTTAPAPGDCAQGVAPNTVFFDDLESGAPGWTHAAGVGPDTWTLSTARPYSGLSSLYGEDVAEISDQYLVSPAVALPGDEAPLTLQFWNWQQIEASGTGCYDGAVVEVTTDGGSNWTRLESELLTDPYDGPVSTSFSNPIAGDNAWCGDPQDWLESIVDLDTFAGELVQFRFRLATDSSVSREGWYIDDVKVQACPATLIFTDGFESGDTSAWSATVP